eukprot:COSAG02_NODE_5767_length_4055_cov_2.085693_6_plen_32_part_00
MKKLSPYLAFTTMTEGNPTSYSVVPLYGIFC